LISFCEHCIDILFDISQFYANSAIVNTESFGEFVKCRRKQLRLTQRAVAQALGMNSIAFISEVEAGSRHLAEEHWPKLAELLETAVEELAQRDVKAPIQEARRLVARNPDYAVVFRRVLEQSKHLSAEEILRQMDLGEKNKSDA
jgi:transcriptional regulator with XRE-family HTH domain